MKKYTILLLLIISSSLTGQNNLKTETSEKQKNVIAILPVIFINNQAQNLNLSNDMAILAQNDIYNLLNERLEKIFPINIQDIRQTNILLKNAGIDFSNIDLIPIQELQNILNVDYIICSKLSYFDQKRTRINENENTKISNDSKNSKTIVTKNIISNSATNILLITKVYLDIYKEGNKIYSKSRVPFAIENDGWILTMKYLLKRSPIFN